LASTASHPVVFSIAACWGATAPYQLGAAVW